MHDPIRGVTPKISYRIPELDDTEDGHGQGRLKLPRPKPGRLRGRAGYGSTTQRTPTGRDDWTKRSAHRDGSGSEPIRCISTRRKRRNLCRSAASVRRSQMFVVHPPAGFVPSSEQVDMHLYFEGHPHADATASAGPPLIAPPVQSTAHNRT